MTKKRQHNNDVGPIVRRLSSGDTWEYHPDNSEIEDELLALSTLKGDAHEAMLAKIVSRINGMCADATLELYQQGFYDKVHPGLVDFFVNILSESQQSQGAWVKPTPGVGRPFQSSRRNDAICRAVSELTEQQGMSIAAACREVAKRLLARELGEFDDNLSWRTIKNIYHNDKQSD